MTSNSHADFDLTVLAPKPLGSGGLLRRSVRALRTIAAGGSIPSLGGHFAVTRSARDGLRKRGSELRWRLTSKLDGHRSTVVHVLAGQEQLAQAIDARSRGLCDRVIAGPNIVMWPDDDPLLIEADAVVVPSQWVLDAYESRLPGIGAKSVIWAAGVDADYWQPTRSKRPGVTVYNKGRDAEADAVRKLLTDVGHQVHMISYGSYRPKQYRAALDQSFACVVVGKSESQGLAIAEAWAMNVPTLVARFDVLFGSIPCSAAPYLSPETGLFWDNPGEIRSGVAAIKGLQPRPWLLSNQTDARSIDLLLHILWLER